MVFMAREIWKGVVLPHLHTQVWKSSKRRPNWSGAVLRGEGLGGPRTPNEKCAPHFGPAPLDFHLNRPVISLIQLHIMAPGPLAGIVPPVAPPPIWLVPEPPLQLVSADSVWSQQTADRLTFTQPRLQWCRPFKADSGNICRPNLADATKYDERVPGLIEA